MEIELIAETISKEDNTVNVEMTMGEIWFLKHFIKKYNPKKIVEIGISAGGNTVNLLKWKDNNAQLFSIDIAKEWYRDNTKLSGFMADEADTKDNWKIYRGYDYLDIYEDIGNDIDFIIIDTVHSMPGEFLTFLAALPQLKDGCIVILHDIHLNMRGFSINSFGEYHVAAYCTGLLFGGVSSNNKWSLKSDDISNIGAFIVDKHTRDNIKDIFHILCSAWYSFPSELNLTKYSEYIHKYYSLDCYDLFNTCLDLQSKYFDYEHGKKLQTARIDLINVNNNENTIEILDKSQSVDIDFPNWFKTDKGNGAVIQTHENAFYIKLKCINDGLLNISLMGPDIRDKMGNRIPSYVDFKTLKINNKDILNNPVTVCHDAPYVFEKNIKDGEIIEIYAKWNKPKS